MSARTLSPLDNLVYDCMLGATESILRERKASLRPITSQTITEFMDYIRYVLNNWKMNMATALTLDIYIHVPKTNEHVLLERWSFAYLITSDLKGDARPFAVINRRVQTLLRSLYCFVRMLPGFNMLHSCSVKPILSFQLYAEQQKLPSQFKFEVSRYQFAKISTSRGLISIGVTFLNSTPVKAIIKMISSGSLNAPSSSGNVSNSNATTPQPIRRESLSSASPPVPIPGSSPSSYEGNSGLGMASRGRTASSDAREMHRRSFQLPSEGPGQSRSFETGGRGNPVDASPFRPNEVSHLYGATGVQNRSSPVASTSPGYFGSLGSTPNIPIPHSASNNTNNLLAKSAGTPVGSYSAAPFAFQQMLEERNSDGSTKDLLPIGSSPPFPPYSTSLTSTSPHLMGPLYSTSLSEKRLSFRKNAIIGDANNTNSGLSAAMAAASIHNDSNQSGGLTLAPSQLMLPEWQLLRQRLSIPSFPIKALGTDGNADLLTNNSNKMMDLVSDKERRQFSSFDSRADGAAPTRSSSGGTRDDFFDKLKEDVRTSFFGDDDDDLPFVVHHTELAGNTITPRNGNTSEAPKQIESIVAECRLTISNFKQFAASYNKLDTASANG